MQNYPRLSDRVMGGCSTVLSDVLRTLSFSLSVTSAYLLWTHMPSMHIYIYIYIFFFFFFNENVILDYVRVNAIV